MTYLEAHGLEKWASGTCIIKNVNLYVKEHEVVSLVGISGVGKTTCFQVISGLSTPDNGTVNLSGEEITGKRGHIGYMMQKDLLLEHMTISANLSLPLRLKGVPRKQAAYTVSECLQEFGLQNCAKKYPSQLSGGMRQRIAFLRTNLMGTKMLLLDEPFSALDAVTKTQMHVWFLQQIHKGGISVLLVTHDIAEAVALSDRVYVLGGKPGMIRAEIGTQNQENASLVKEILSSLELNN